MWGLLLASIATPSPVDQLGARQQQLGGYTCMSAARGCRLVFSTALQSRRTGLLTRLTAVGCSLPPH